MITKKENLGAKKFSAIFVLLFSGAILSVSIQEFFSVTDHPSNQVASVIGASKKNAEEIRAGENPFQNISIEARAVYVFDLKTNTTLFSKNESEKLPLASVTKLMTALVAREHVRERAVATLSADDISAEGDSGLRVDERWRMVDLLNFMLIISSNDAAHAVSGLVGAEGHEDSASKEKREYFIKMMNEKAHALGFTTMEFFNESGLDISATQNGGYGSAREVALLMNELWRKYPEVLEITARKNARIYSEDNIVHILPNTNEIVGRIPGLIASKTGYTDLAGGNLAVIFDRGIGDPVIIVVLGSTYKGRFDDMQKLVSVIREL